MKKTTTYCDVCGKDNATAITQFEERKPDGAGGSENWYYYVDLCPACITTFFKALLETADSLRGYLRAATDGKGQAR